jgi:hypothetical protein
MRRRRRGFAFVLAAALAAPALAGEVDKTAPFVLDQWIELGATDGPVTLHRIRLVRQGGVTKSKLMRPGGSQYLEDVQLQLEFSNVGSQDWESRWRIEWTDAAGAAIDGYDGSENLDSGARYEQQTVTLSTLRYGLDRGKQLTLRIEFFPD